MQNSTILFIIPNHYNLPAQIENNLKYCGFNVLTLSEIDLDKNFQYPNTKTHIHHFLRKIFLHDWSIKDQLRKEWRKQTAARIINKIFDYTFVIRPDLCPDEIMQQLHQHTKHTVAAYQWDGIDRFPEVFATMHYFDRFFVFDQRDIIHHPELPLLGITNFYFDFNPTPHTTHKNNAAYFIGAHSEQRMKSINYCAQVLIDLGIDLHFTICSGQEEQKKFYPNEKINFIEKGIEFSANLQNVMQADILVDFVNPIHQGLSFRIFEALYYGKKLITNNPTVKDYDFYHPNNIFVWDGKDLSGLPEFLALPLHPINARIIEKYSFSNWIKNILDIPHYQPITLPKASKPSA